MATTYESQKEDISALWEEFSKRIEKLTRYVKKFSMLVLEVPRMDEEDKLHYFMEVL
ncbi:unnamed protein product [Spirodela intermedia]|uniref:Uncharacterized protein n=2 Tax=Spirodela intermedia TaxID=51605 RepID=A0A7I8LC29_SPIIN|nr:unnamed protein product [Spirodela intermedia]CAA6669843.1 unnamed protein product [Spirodela intermedia]CAA7406815.1 unnamed protein product [Spirodela intermedia]